MTQWRLERGASLEEGGVRFEVWAPRARRLEVKIEGVPASPFALREIAEGVFAGRVEGLPDGVDYHYRIDGERDRPDPVSRWQRRGVHGPSVVVDPARFEWTDARWRGVELADLVLYELHVGTFTGEGTFTAAIDRLHALRDLGVTAIELMPVAEFPGARNWGYDGAHPYAPQSTYGGPKGLRRLVDAAHRAGLGVVLDVVYNHLGPEGNYLAEFGPYFTDRHRTPWGSAINFDDAESDEVRRYFIDNALYWVTEFHVDGLRLDAVHAIYDFGARHVLEELASAVHAQAASLGRTVVVIAESDLNDPRIIRPREIGGYGLDAQWSDDFHHAVHAALTGERRGYYADFGGVVPVAKAMRDRFVLDGRRSAFRRRRHGAPASDATGERFVVFVQNHDQVGNRAEGERLTSLAGPEKCRLAAALLLLSPYVPLLFMGEEYGEMAPFLYFTSHGDPALGEAVRRGRREEFARFDWPGEVPDPQAEETFLRSRLDWRLRDEPEHAKVLRLYRDLLALRKAEPALRPGAAAPSVSSGRDEDPWIVLETAVRGEVAFFAVFALGAKPIETRVPERPGGGWRIALSTDDVAYGGRGRTALEGGRVAVPPTSAVALVRG